MLGVAATVVALDCARGGQSTARVRRPLRRGLSRPHRPLARQHREHSGGRPGSGRRAGRSGIAGARRTVKDGGPEAQAAASEQAKSEVKSENVARASLVAWKGLRVARVEFQGVTFGSKDALPEQLPQQPGQPLDPAKVAASIRRLFASGRYRDIHVQGERELMAWS